MSGIAIIQRPPTFLNRNETISDAVAGIREAARGAAQSIVFPGAFIPGYLAWIWRLRPGGDVALSERLHSLPLANAVELDGNHLEPLRETARQNEVTIVCCIDERDTEFSHRTIYNTVVVIEPDGAVVNRHWKVMPTTPERMVWGSGTRRNSERWRPRASALEPLLLGEAHATRTLYLQGVDIYISPTFDTGERWIATMQRIGPESGCWVLASGSAFQTRHIPDAVPGKAELYPNLDEKANASDSVVVAPGG